MGEKDDFLKQRYTKRNFVTTGGLGIFDVELNPKAKRLNITTRVFLYVKDNALRKRELEDFRKKMAKYVPQFWNDRATIVCAKTGWEDVRVTPNFSIISVSNWTEAHYAIEIVQETEAKHFLDPDAKVTEKLYADQYSQYPVRSNNPLSARFGQQAIRKGEKSSYNTNIKYDLCNNPVHIPIEEEKIESDRIACSRLQKFAREIQPLSGPTLKIVVVGGDQKVSTDYNKYLALEVARKLKDYGVVHNIQVQTAPVGNGVRRAVLSFEANEFKEKFPQKSGKKRTPFEQITVVHEYGHMLGLPDEYLCMSEKTEQTMVDIFKLSADNVNTFKGSARSIADVKKTPTGERIPHIVKHQMSFVELCARANLVPPEFGRLTTSIMSNGMVFHPHHFVTLWEAVCHITDFDDWKILLNQA